MLYFFSMNFEMLNLMGLGSTSRLAGLLYITSVITQLDSLLYVKSIKKFVLPWLIWFTYLFVISYINITHYTTIGQVFDLTILLNILVFIILINHEKKDPGIFLKGLLSYAVGSIVLTILYYLKIGIHYEFNRVTIFDDNQNNVGLRLAISLIIILYACYQYRIKLWIKGLLLLSVPFSFTFLLDTGSRVSVLSLGLALLISAALIRTDKWYKKAILYVGLGFILYKGINVTMKSGIIIDRLTKTVEEGDLAGRDRIWTVTLQYIENNIIFGGGRTGFYKYSTESFGAYNGIHNVILEMLAFTGIIGLVIYLYFLYQISKNVISNYFQYKDLLQLLLIIPVMGMILSGHALNSKIAWAILAFSCITPSIFAQFKSKVS